MVMEAVISNFGERAEGRIAMEGLAIVQQLIQIWSACYGLLCVGRRWAQL
jgi:hypothetical protein